jgi:hypothetical protein
MSTVKFQTFALSTVMLASLAACGGGSDSGGTSAIATGPTATVQSVSVPFTISDASSQDWSTIQVTVTSVVFVSASGNTANLLAAPVTVNLEQLDNLSEALGSASLTAGTTYTGAVLMISANPGDISLTVASDPQAGFSEAPSTATTPDVIPAGRIQIQGAQGAVGSQTVTVPVTFATPFVAPAPASSSSTAPTATPAINIEFDLSHPAFIVGHTPVGGGSTIWAINFQGPVKHKPSADITRLVLRHMYATASAVSTDNSFLTVTRDFPTLPIVSPETFVAGTQTLSIKADVTNGTLFYDLDAKTHSTIKDFSTVATTLATEKYLRVAARYQQDGSLVATRIYASASFNKAFVSPEGHVTHVDGVNGTSFVVDAADGKPIRMAVDANTQFFFRNPGTASDVAPIGVGSAFLTTHNLVRGFKVHVTPVDLTAVPMLAASVDIEAAPYEGKIGSVTATGFALTKTFNTSADNYSVSLSYLNATTANGKDPLTGAAITGFKYWNFAHPTLVTSGSGAVPSFVGSTGGSVNFGGSVGAYSAHAAAYSTWGDVSNLNGWAAAHAVLIPTVLPNTKVAAGLSGSSFTINSAGGTTPVTVDITTTAGSATLVYQVDRTGEVVTVTPQNISTATGLAALTSGLVAGAHVQVSAVPQADGTLMAYTVNYFTGTAAK